MMALVEYISAPQRPTLYITPFSYSTKEIPSWNWLKNVNKTIMVGCRTRIEEEKGAIYRVGRCGAEMYDWWPTPFILLGVDDEKVELSFGK